MQKKNKIGINGLGRIGRYLMRLAILDPHIEIGLVNDLADIHTLMHLFKYDSIHGVLDLSFDIDGNKVIFSNGKIIRFSQQKDPSQIAWANSGVTTVVDCTGLFLTKKLASQHFKGGANKVLLSAPPKDENVPTVVMGVNDHTLSLQDTIISNASCTTNNVAPIVKVIKSLVDIEMCYISTIHSYTSDQRIHDSPHRDLRRSRAVAHSIIPTTTGAAKAITKIFPDLKGKIDGSAIRVPVSNGSMTEITFNVTKPLSMESIHHAMMKSSKFDLKGVLGIINDPIVSIDIVGSALSSAYDIGLSKSFGKVLKIIAWYDNEAGYSNRLLDLIKKVH